MPEPAERLIDLVCWRILYYSKTVEFVATAELKQTKGLPSKDIVRYMLQTFQGHCVILGS